MKSRITFLFAIIAAQAMALVGCTKDDNFEESFEQPYYISLAFNHPYNEDRYHAADSLLDFITADMCLVNDTASNTWLVKAESLEACDKEITDKFNHACSLVDPELYGGKYIIFIGRKDSEGKTVRLVEKEFVATADNYGNDDYDHTVITCPEGFYIWDMAIASSNKSGKAQDALRNNGFNKIIDGNLNQNAGGKYIYVGFKMEHGDKYTTLTGTVMNESTGTMETRLLTAKEAAISYVVCVQNSGHPDTFKGPNNGPFQNYVFERFKHLGDSNGDTNQGSGGYDSFLYFSRSNNHNQHINSMFFVSERYAWYLWWYKGSDRTDLIKTATYINKEGRCSISSNSADLNINTCDDYTYLGFSVTDN